MSDPDDALRAAGLPVEEPDRAELAEQLEAFSRGSARLREYEEGATVSGDPGDEPWAAEERQRRGLPPHRLPDGRPAT